MSTLCMCLISVLDATNLQGCSYPKGLSPGGGRGARLRLLRREQWVLIGMLQLGALVCQPFSQALQQLNQPFM